MLTPLTASNASLAVLGAAPAAGSKKNTRDHPCH
jgi:hypothetical protein